MRGVIFDMDGMLEDAVAGVAAAKAAETRCLAPTA
jgi:beta-phosphoglucomutase-like phosphatase (HAD superfamily)